MSKYWRNSLPASAARHAANMICPTVRQEPLELPIVVTDVIARSDTAMLIGTELTTGESRNVWLDAKHCQWRNGQLFVSTTIVVKQQLRTISSTEK